MPGPAASDALLATKFSVPRGPRAAVLRHRLLDRLDTGVQGPLTLVAAPAGAGKSALLSSWIAEGRPPGPVAWLSLDTDDADRRRFWRGVLAALAKATGDDAVAALAVSPREPMRMGLVLPALVDALEGAKQPVVLVLDDFHEVIDAVHEDLERLVRFPPPALRLVIVTRADPPIGLGRLRLDGSLTEIRAADLSFSLDEAGALFGALGIALAPEDLATLWRRTEGWAAALRLAAVSLQHHPDPRAFIEHFAGTDATISDYLVSEVLARQPPELRDFLLRTSVVDTLSAELADALTGATDGHAMLARLEHGGVLTTPLDERGTWHRYHPLFAELLRAELRAQLPDEVAQLHRRAATWLAAHGDDAAALRHAAAGGAWDLAADLTTTRWFHMMIDGEMGTLRPILETMPRQFVEASPELALAFGGALLARGDHAGAQPYLRRAEEGEALVPPERRASFAASRAAMAPVRGPPARRSEGRALGRPRAARASRRPRERRPEQRRAVLRPRTARHRRALDRRPRLGDRSSRAGLRQRPRRGQRLDRPRRHRAPRGGARVPRRARCARCATPTRPSSWPCAAAGDGRSRRVPPTACRRPSPSNAASARRPRTSWPAPRRHCTRRASARCARCTPSIARCC